jgi:hypothetical protein
MRGTKATSLLGVEEPTQCDQGTWFNGPVSFFERGRKCGRDFKERDENLNSGI